MNENNLAKYVIYYSQYIDLQFITKHGMYNPLDPLLDYNADYRKTDWALFKDILYRI